MIEERRKYSLSPIQLFFMVLSYVFSGFFLHSENSFFAVVFTCFFTSAICAVAWLLCKNYNCSRELFSNAFGRSGMLICVICGAFVFLSLARTAFSFSYGISRLYGGNPTLIFFAFIIMGVIAVSGGFFRASRFAELCFFSIVAVILVAVFDVGTGSFDYNIDTNSFMASFNCIGNSVVIFSLFLSCITENDKEASQFMKNGSFHPSPLLCGICGVFTAGILYVLVNFIGSGVENPLISFFSWFSSLVRGFAFFVSASDLFGITQAKNMDEKKKRAVAAASVFAFSLLIRLYLPDTVIAETEAVFTLIFPFVIFSFLVFRPLLFLKEK